MTIEEYFNNYKSNSVFPFYIKTSDSRTLDDFYNNCIREIYENVDIINNMIAWHNMLVEYSKDDESIFWVRQYESGKENTNDNRRASLVEFLDGFKILYVSNFDAQEILNMAIRGVIPDLQEFKRLMKNHDYFFHYHANKTNKSVCAEAQTNSFPNKLNAKEHGVLTKSNFYLAHIRAVNEEEYFIDDNYYFTTSKGNKSLHDKLYPYGKIDDYNIGKPTQKNRVFRQNYSLNDQEKQIIKSHFIRFVDPLNYFPIPGEKNHIYEYNYGSKKYKNIGEFPPLLSYMYEKMQTIFTSINFKEFDEITCFDKTVFPVNDSQTIVNVAVRAPKKYDALSAIKKISRKMVMSNFSDSTKTRLKGKAESKISDLTKIKVIYEFLNNKKCTYNQLDTMLGYPANNHGNVSYNLVKNFKDKKGVLAVNSIDDEIDIANGIYKDYLLEIKKEYNL